MRFRSLFAIPLERDDHNVDKVQRCPPTTPVRSVQEAWVSLRCRREG